MHELVKVGRLPRIKVTGTQALALSSVITNLVRIVSTMCLTRLLSPDVFGITGMIMSTFYVVNMFTDIGLQAYVVRHSRTDERHFLDSVYTIHAIRGVCLAAIGAALAWPLSKLLDKPELFLPLAVASLVFIIDGHISLYQFRGLREGRIQRFSMIDLTTSVTQTISTIILAVFLRNVWAIVFSMFIASIAKVTVGYYLFPEGRHSFRPDREIAADLWRFSRVMTASSILTLVISQTDKLILGRILSLEQFGTYVIATSLAIAPAVFAANYASAVVYPAMAAAWREGQSVRDAYYRYHGRFFYLYLLGTGGVIGGANLIIRILYDPRYLQAATYLSILAIGTAFTLLTRSLETVEVAGGRPRTAIELNLARLVWVGAGAGLAITRADALILVFTIGLMELPAYFYGNWRLARLRVFRWSRELAALLVIATGVAGGAATAYIARLLLPRL